MGRHEEAIAQGQRARELDPVSLAAGYTLAAAYHWAWQSEQSAAEAERLEQLDPTYPGAHVHWGLTYLQRKSYDEAVRRFQRAIALSGEDMAPFTVAWLGCAYARAGRRREAQKTLEKLQARSKHKYISPYLVAIVHASLGDEGQTFEWLEKAYAERNPMLAFLRVDFHLAAVRSDPRFKDLLCRMNFPP